MFDVTTQGEIKNVLDSGKRKRKLLWRNERKRLEVFWRLVQEQDSLGVLALERSKNPRHRDEDNFLHMVRSSRSRICDEFRISHGVLLEIEEEGLEKSWLNDQHRHNGLNGYETMPIPHFADARESL